MKSNPKQKALYLTLCILAAIVVWIFVDNYGNNGGPNIKTKWFRDVPVTYTGETVLTERGFMLLDEGTVTTVDLELEGTMIDLALLDKDYLRVTVDLSNVSRTGVQSVTSVIYGYTEEYFRQRITVNDRTPSTITINVAELYHKTVDVRCEITGNVAEGYSAGKVQLSQTSIAVRGQEEEIAKVSYAKVIFDIGKNTKETVTADLDYQFYDEDGQVLNLSGIHAEAGQIQATLPVYVTKELKLTVDFKEAPGAQLADMIWAIKPESVVVSGDASVLNDMDSIVLDSFDLLSVTTESTSHSYAILVPDGCENLSGVTRATLEIGYPDKTVADVTTHNIRVENASASRNVELLTQELSVRIFGTAAEMEGITGEDVAVVADLSDYAVASGTYMIPAQVRVGDGKTIGVSGTYQVQVRIPEF